MDKFNLRNYLENVLATKIGARTIDSATGVSTNTQSALQDLINIAENDKTKYTRRQFMGVVADRAFRKNVDKVLEAMVPKTNSANLISDSSTKLPKFSRYQNYVTFTFIKNRLKNRT